MGAPILEERAAQARMLSHALKVRCPDHERHWYARPEVPCYPPSEQYPWGWICVARIERDADTEAGRKAFVRAEQQKRDREAFLERKAKRAAFAADASTTTQEES